MEESDWKKVHHDLRDLCRQHSSSLKTEAEVVIEQPKSIEGDWEVRGSSTLEGETEHCIVP